MGRRRSTGKRLSPTPAMLTAQADAFVGGDGLALRPTLDFLKTEAAGGAALAVGGGPGDPRGQLAAGAATTST